MCQFFWRVRGGTSDTNYVGPWSEVFAITIITDVDDFENIIPQDYTLHQNFPNPFNPTTMVRFGIHEQANVKIEVFNMLGQSAGVLVDTEKSTGFHEISWNAENLPSGIYLISIRAVGINSKQNFVQVNKALLLK